MKLDCLTDIDWHYLSKIIFWLCFVETKPLKIEKGQLCETNASKENSLKLSKPVFFFLYIKSDSVQVSYSTGQSCFNKTMNIMLSLDIIWGDKSSFVDVDFDILHLKD